MPRDTEAEARQRYRAFIRANHPDAGGDPQAFAAGLAQLRARLRPEAARSRRDRYDAPVLVVRDPSGFGSVARRVQAWYRRKRRTRVR